MQWHRSTAVLVSVLTAALLAPLAAAKETKPKTIQRETQAEYIERMKQQSPDLWLPGCRHCVPISKRTISSARAIGCSRNSRTK